MRFEPQRLPLYFRLLCCVALLGSTGTARAAGKGVRVQTHSGWEGSLVLESVNAGVKTVVVPAIGGRIAHYSLHGENILFENPGSEGKTLANTKGSFWVGGYQCDIGPEIQDIPDHPNLWMGRYKSVVTRDYTVRVFSEPDATVGIRLEKEILLDGDSGELALTQWMKNTSAKPAAFCLWDRTLCKGGGFAFFPLNPKSRFATGWSLRNKVAGKWVYDGQTPASPNVRVLNGVLIAEAKGAETKIGADSDAEWIAYVRGKLLFVKYFPYFPKGSYPDGGNSVELYWSDRVAELEPLSPEVILRPEQSYAFPEKWALYALPAAVTSFEQARELVGRIPPSPFKAEP